MASRGNITTVLRMELTERDPPFRMVCPVCLGGSDHEECLTVYDAENGDATLATCHRAACAIETINVGNTEAMSARRHAGRSSNRAAFNYADMLERSKVIPEHWASPTRFTYSGKAMSKHMLIDEKSGRLVFPMYDSMGDVRGVVAKRTHMTLGGHPKSLTYADEGYDRLSWYTSGTLQHDIYMVEDCLSALAIMDSGGSAVSLNGVHVGDRASTIGKWYDTMYLCLDADATRLAVRTVLNYHGHTPMVVLRLTTDIKDMTRQEVAEFLNRQ